MAKSECPSADDAAKWKENYQNIQRVAQQQKHELSMLKIEAESYQRRNCSLLKQISFLKKQREEADCLQSNQQQTTPTTATKETGICSPTSTQIEQQQLRKINNLEFELNELKEQNIKLKDSLSKMRKEKI